MDDYKILEEKENQLKLDKDLIEVQKTIIYFGNKILKELAEIQEVIKNNRFPKQESPIIEHLLQLKIPPGYKGNNVRN